MQGPRSWGPGPGLSVMTQGPPRPRPGRDVNDQIMSTACTGRRRGGGQFQIIEPSGGREGTKPIFYHKPSRRQIYHNTQQYGSHSRHSIQILDLSEKELNKGPL